MSRVLVDVREEDGLGKGRFDVFTRTTVSVSAGSDLAFTKTSTGVRLSTEETYETSYAHFVVEGTVDSVLFGTATEFDVERKEDVRKD